MPVSEQAELQSHNQVLMSKQALNNKLVLKFRDRDSQKQLEVGMKVISYL